MSQLNKVGSNASKEILIILSTFSNDVSAKSTKVIIPLCRHTVVSKDVLELYCCCVRRILTLYIDAGPYHIETSPLILLYKSMD